MSRTPFVACPRLPGIKNQEIKRVNAIWLEDFSVVAALVDLLNNVTDDEGLQPLKERKVRNGGML